MGTHIRPRPERPDDEAGPAGPNGPTGDDPAKVSARVTATTPIRSIGDVTPETWARVFREVGSPIIGAEVRACYDAATPHTAAALATAVKESQVGKTAPAGTNNALGIGPGTGFPTWADGFASFQRRLATVQRPYVPDDISVRTYCEIYVGGPLCPGLLAEGKPCANGEDFASIGLYIDQFVGRTNSWLGAVTPPPPPTPTPTIFDLASNADASRFGLTPGEKDELLSHRFTNREGESARAIVLHIQDGNTVGSLDWWVHGGPAVQASATVMIQRDGSILRVIPEQHGPWTNGDVMNPTPQSAKLRALGGNPNQWTLSIEAEGYSNDAMPNVELASIVWQVQQWQGKYGIPNDMVLPHSSLNSVTRANCPGSYYPRVMAALTQQPPPVSDWPAEFGAPPVGVTLTMVKRWFGPRFDLAGPVTKRWIMEGIATGDWPALKEIVEGDVREFRFEGGRTYLADDFGNVWVAKR